MTLPIGTVTVTTPGTAVRVTNTGFAVAAVTFKARATNAGAVYIGDDTVSSSSGYELAAGEELALVFRGTVDLRRLYVDAANGNDKVDYAGVTA